MKLFVTNLPRNTTEEELTKHFSSCGTPTSVKIILDRDTGRSRGFGFIEMSSADEAKKAIDELNEKELDGRALIVKEANDSNRKPSRGGNGGGFRGGNGGGGNRRSNY